MQSTNANNKMNNGQGARVFAASPEGEICISGVSGQFPSSHNVNEFEENLYNKVDMITEELSRWPQYHSEIPKRMGNVFDIDRFDAQFFGVNTKQAEIMDPQGRLLLERAYEAITDAGINPKQLRGSRTGVYIGACFAESEKTWFYDRLSERGFGITGCSRAMLANRISYSFGLEGPSFLLDTACSSSMYALDAAFTAIRSGQCDAAIVGGANLLLNPHTSIQFARLGVLAPDGYCRPFDASASGYVRAEAICALFLQKARDAKRVYATVVYSKTNCDGFKLQGITYPSGRVQQNLLTEFYADLGLDARTVDYVEAHSTGTVAGDPEECIALDKVFCTQRKQPLLVGSVKSNIGHTESSSGVCSIAKVILALERGEVSPNINFARIREEIAALRENRMRVCTEVSALPANALVAINSFGFGGANAHCLVRGQTKTKLNNGVPADDLPRLVCWAGRTKESIEVMMDCLLARPLDAEFVGLLHNIQGVEEPGFMHRGYGLLAKSAHADGAALRLASDEQRFDGEKRPLVWIFSGMGSQWPQMGASLLDVPLFRESIERSQQVMRPYNIDLMEILTAPDERQFDDIVISFVGIAAVQIALVDILQTLGLRPDYMIGHSVGELGCGYADGALSAEQMLLAAYWRGRSSQEADLEAGGMAAIGLSHRTIRDMMPDDIDVACHNSAESCTISGPAESVKSFVLQLQAKTIFAREVNSSGIAYHSRYVRPIAERLLENTRDFCPPVRRSERWLSTSVPRSQWHLPENQISSAQYYVNNLLNSVLFEETVALLPANAIAVEIAPHGLLQAIVKKSMPHAVHVPLTQRKSTNSAAHLLIALGKLFLNGITMPLEKLYPAIEFPVSSGTLKIASLMRWDHSDSYFVTNFSTTKTSESGEMRVSVSLEENGEFEYVAGHKIDGRCLFPATGYLELVWITLARMCGTVHHLLNVEFENVQFLRATALRPKETVELNVMVHYGNGAFEVSEGRNSIVTGTVRTIPEADSLCQLPVMEDAPYPDLVRDEFYKELRLRGYQYSGAFQSVERARSDGHCGRICWDMNWVSFMDCMLQIGILARDTRALMLPTRIQKVRIFPTEHQNRVMRQQQHAQGKTVGPILCDVLNNQKLKIIQAGGVEMHNVETNLVSRRKPPGDLVLESYQFVPFLVNYKLNHIDAVRVLVQLVLENYPNLLVLKALEILDDTTDEKPLISSVDDVLRDVPLVKGQLTVLSADPVENQHQQIEVLDASLADQRDAHLIISTNSLDRANLWEQKLTALFDGGFAIVRTSGWNASNCRVPNGFDFISSIPIDREHLILLRKTQPTHQMYKTITLSPKSFEWLTELKESIQTTPVLLVAQNDQHSGILGLVNCIRREPATKPVCCVFVDDQKAPDFNADIPFFKEQLRFNLLMNVYRNGAWGSYRHLQIPPPQLRKPINSHQISHCYANVMRNGDLSSIAWLQGPLRIRSDVSANDSLIRVQYASINFRDVMLATGRLSAEEILDVQRANCDCVLGMEYAGSMRDGRRMMGVVPSGAMATLIRPFKPLMWSVPEQWSLREAATVPIVYMTVYSAFFLGQPIAAGKSILIHAGSGGVGLAAIRVALAYGLEVFTTVSNAQKQHYIMQKFPQLKECNIGNSRDCSFEQMIKLRTGGEGVDFVLNSLSDDKLVASVRCLGRAGVFLEIGKFDLANDTKLGLGVFLKEMSFRSVLADNLFLPSHIEQTRYIHQLIERDMCTGVIVPLDASVFGVLEVEKAYRYLSTGQHVGKVLVQICDPDQSVTAASAALPRVYFEPQRVYVVAGGLGGFGLELIDWLVLRGARRVLISSSRGISSKYQVYRMRVWQSYGCNIHVSTADISSAAGCRELLRQAGQLGSVAGIFNLAVRLRDGLLANQTEEGFRECAAPKSVATATLDALSRQLYPADQLAHFVVFSSVSCGRGNAGQSNYGWTNAVMERIVERRVADGLAGKAIQWGGVGDVGLAAQMLAANSGDDVEIAGTQTQRIASCLAELDALLTCPEPVVSSMVLARKSDDAADARDKQQLTMLESVLNIMSIRNMNTISMSTSMSELGMDSLMTIEIKQALEREFDVLLTTQDLRAMTFQQLQQLSAQKSSSSSSDGLAQLAGDSLEQQLKVQQQQRSRMIDLRALLADDVEFAASQMRTEKLFELRRGVGEQVWVLMPGIEGDHRRVWKSIAERTNATTYILKYGESAEVQSLQEVAASFAQAIQTRFPAQKPFSLVGYSFGALIALEVARCLERSGQQGHIVCVDGSPEFLRQLIVNFISAGSKDAAVKFTLEAFENSFATVLIHNYVPAADLAEVSAFIEAQTEWPAKIDKVLEYIQLWSVDCRDFDAQFVLRFTNGVHQRVMAAMEYIEQSGRMEPIKAAMTLLRAADSKVSGLDDSYDLRICTAGKVSVQTGAGNHQTILNNPMLCDILNAFQM